MNLKLPAAAFLLAALACVRPPSDPPFGIAVDYDVATLDPHAENRVGNFSVLSNVYEPLVRTDADLKLEPCLATGWESPDPLTWILRLRSGVRFQSGRPLRADDVVYSFKRLLRENDLEMRAFVLGVSEIEAVGPLAVRLRTVRPTRILLGKLNFVLIVPEGSGRESLRHSADGTGPFSLTSWRRGESVHLRRHEGYWGPPAALTELAFFLGRTPKRATGELLAGRHQLTVSDDEEARGLEASGRGIQVLRRQSIFVRHLSYDLSREITAFCSVTPNPFRDKRVRRALHAAIDRGRLVDRLSKRVTVASQPVPRFIFGFDPALSEPVADRTRARALLGQAGLAGGFEAVLHVRKPFEETGRLLKEQLADVGIRLEVRVLPVEEFWGLLGRHEATLWLGGYGCPTGDASDFFDAAIHSSDSARQLGSVNWAGYSNPELDRAIEDSSAIEDVRTRRLALQRIMGVLMDELVLIPLYVDQDTWAVDGRYSWSPRSDSYIRAADIVPR